MSVIGLTAAKALAQIDEFDAIIDARSPSEWAKDRLPNAINWPSLNDQERAQVGEIYVQNSPFQARKVGAALVARNIASIIEHNAIDLPQSFRPLIYCWRGGQRSSALAHVLGQIGFRVHLLEGGYKSFRSVMIEDIPQKVGHLCWRVLCGPTGSGKTHLLHALHQMGAQTLDLEALANHRSSVLGLIPELAQPTQKHFEMLLWDQLRNFDSQRPVWVEAESRKVGDLALPASLMAAMRESPCTIVQLPEHERVALLMRDYPYFVDDRDLFCDRLSVLASLRGHDRVEGWIADVRAGRIQEVVQQLLLHHYDPGYTQSTRRNFTAFEAAQTVVLPNSSQESLNSAAQQILNSEHCEPPRKQ